MKIRVSTPIEETPRVMQVRGIFDLAEEKSSTVEWDVHLPLNEKPWNIGLIVGPSGCGKSTIASKLWGQDDQKGEVFPKDQSILDAFPESLGIKEITELLSSVGFSSPPAWLRPFHVLSTGQKFRVTLARMIAEALCLNGKPTAAMAHDELPNQSPTPSESETQTSKPSSHKTSTETISSTHGHAKSPIVFDEYTSVVDRTVAQIGSAAVAKVIRKKNLQFVAVTCHEDVEEWLQPDWVYRPAENTFSWRLLRQRPTIELKIVRCHSEAWKLFAPHHYLDAKLAPAAVCFLATWKGQPVAFSAWLPFFGAGPPRRREHRTVTLPDYQGVGIGNVVSATIASMWKGLGIEASSTTTHPAMVAARNRSKVWRMTRAPSMPSGRDVVKHASTRLTAGFEYIGPAMSQLQAKALYAS